MEKNKSKLEKPITCGYYSLLVTPDTTLAFRLAYDGGFDIRKIITTGNLFKENPYLLVRAKYTGCGEDKTFRNFEFSEWLKRPLLSFNIKNETTIEDVIWFGFRGKDYPESSHHFHYFKNGTYLGNAPYYFDIEIKLSCEAYIIGINNHFSDLKIINK